MRQSKSVANAWFGLAWSSMELMRGSASVIVKRSSAMAAAGAHPTAADKREMRQMVMEKASASVESWTSLAFASASVYQSMALTAVRAGRAPNNAELQRAAIKVVTAAAAPYRAKVRGNLKRLVGT